MVFRFQCGFLPFTMMLGLFLICHQARSEESRIWTSTNGKYEIRAKFVDIKDGKARLERPNGDITRIPLEKLCEDDQKYIRAHKDDVKPSTPHKSEKNGLAIGDRVEAKDFRKWKLGTVTEIDYEWERVRVRFDGESERGRRVSLDDMRIPGTTQHPVLVKPAEPAPHGIEIVRPDLSDMARPVANGSVATKILGDPRSDSLVNWKPKSVRLNGRTNFHENPKDFSLILDPEPFALVVHASPGFGGDDPARIELVDLRKKKTIAGGPALPDTERVFFSPTGKRIATMTAQSGPQSTGQLDIWSIDGKEFSHLISFSPYAMDTWPNVDPKWFEWLENDRFFTANREGRVLLWQVEGAKAVYELIIDRGAMPILSPGKKQIAVPSVDGVQIYNAQDGNLLATVGSGNLRHAALAFSPSGRQLAAISNGFVDVMDVSTGEMTRSFPCQGVSGSKEVWWIDEEFLFASNSLLINVPKRIIAWKYEIGNSLLKPVGKTQWLLVDNRVNKTQILSPFQLPPPAAIEAINGLRDEDLLAVRPGQAVSVDVKINDGLLAKAVGKSLKEALEQAGMKVGENETLTLVATMKHGKTEKIYYRKFGDFHGQGESFEVTNRVYELQLLLDGVPIWKRTSVHSPPHHIQMERGETIRSAIARVMKPQAANFRGRLPAHVVRPEFQEPFGISTISPNG